MNGMRRVYDFEKLDIEQKRWLKEVQRRARLIDPTNAEVTWFHSFCADPYDLLPHDPRVHDTVGREFFARAPGARYWIWFSNLPDQVENALRKRYERWMYFPNGWGILTPNRVCKD